jgi:hypothetical protein
MAGQAQMGVSFFLKDVYLRSAAISPLSLLVYWW